MRWEQRAFFDCLNGKLKTYPAFDMDGQMIQICAYPNDDHGIQQQKCFKPPLISMSGKLSLCNSVFEKMKNCSDFSQSSPNAVG